MPEQSKVDKMNEALADFVIKRIESVDPTTATPNELSSIAQLARTVNDAPTGIELTGLGMGAITTLK